MHSRPRETSRLDVCPDTLLGHCSPRVITAAVVEALEVDVEVEDASEPGAVVSSPPRPRARPPAVVGKPIGVLGGRIKRLSAACSLSGSVGHRAGALRDIIPPPGAVEGPAASGAAEVPGPRLGAE